MQATVNVPQPSAGSNYRYSDRRGRLSRSVPERPDDITLGGSVLHIRVAVGILTRGEDLLLVRQVSNGFTYWSLPGGVAEADETLLQALDRELYEEVGIRPSGAVELDHVTELRTASFISVASVFRVPNWSVGRNPAYDPSGEVIDHGFFTLDEARERLGELPWPSMREPILDVLSGDTGRFWSYEVHADQDLTAARNVTPRR